MTLRPTSAAILRATSPTVPRTTAEITGILGLTSDHIHDVFVELNRLAWRGLVRGDRTAIPAVWVRAEAGTDELARMKTEMVA